MVTSELGTGTNSPTWAEASTTARELVPVPNSDVTQNVPGLFMKPAIHKRLYGIRRFPRAAA